MREVLIVDDERDAADTLAALLRLHGFVVHVAYDSNEAIARAIACNPDAFILDLEMAGQDGFNSRSDCERTSKTNAISR